MIEVVTANFLYVPDFYEIMPKNTPDINNAKPDRRKYEK